MTQPANIGKRIAATIIDYGMIAVVFFVAVMQFGVPNEEGGKTLSGLPFLALMAGGFLCVY